MELASVEDLGGREQLERGPCLTAEDIWFGYDRGAPLLRGVSLAVERGSMTMVLGRSGSGKTTLLKILKGLIRPHRGVVRLLVQREDATTARDRIAYVPQTLGLVRTSTALENTLVGALSRTGTVRSLLKWFSREALDEARSILTRLGLGEKVDTPAHRLSGGERQRVAIARALMQRPALVLADEFVSQLDPATSEDVLRLMRDVTTAGVSLVVTTHETDVVSEFADRVVVLRDGRIAFEGPPALLSRRKIAELVR
jgi:ABC-type phosphate/phosphonate transport system ATPase subunit